jgi:hypothetical protein
MALQGYDNVGSGSEELTRGLTPLARGAGWDRFFGDAKSQSFGRRRRRLPLPYTEGRRRS